MSAWGVKALENDDALDFIDVWSVYCVPAIQAGESESKQNIAHDFLLGIYFRNGVNHLEPSDNLKIIAAAHAFIDLGIEINDELRCILERAIFEEKQPDQLECYEENAKKRRDYLNRFAKKLGCKLLKNSEVSSEFSHLDEVIELEKFKSCLKIFCGLEEVEEKSIFEKQTPSVNERLSSMIFSRMGDYLTDEEYKLLDLRMVAITYWIACGLELGGEEIYRLCKLAEKQGFFWSYLLQRNNR